MPFSSSTEISGGISAPLSWSWFGAVCMTGKLIMPSCSLLAGISPSLSFFSQITFSFEKKLFCVKFKINETHTQLKVI